MNQTCNYCHEHIKETSFLTVDSEIFYHINHFNCQICGKSLSELPYYEKDHKKYCEEDFHNNFSPICHFCGGIIKEQYISALGFSYHKDHFKCSKCDSSLSTKFFKNNDIYFCENCYSNDKAKICCACNLPILDYVISALNQFWHSNCFICFKCKEKIGKQSFTVNNVNLFHVNCYKEEFFEKCFLCGKFCENEYYQAENKALHEDCLEAYNEFKRKKKEESKLEEKIIFNIETEKTEIINNVIDPEPISLEDEKMNIRCSIEKNHNKFQEEKSESEGSSSELNVPSKMDEIRKEIERIKEIQSNEKKKKRELKIKEEEIYYNKNNQDSINEFISNENEQCFYSYKILSGNDLPSSIDISKKESYLNDEDFQTIFRMNKSQYYSLPKWRQTDMKKKLKLF